MSPMIVYSISHTVAFLSEALDPSAHPTPQKKIGTEGSVLK